MERVIVGGVDVRFGGGYGDFNLILVLPCLDDTEIRTDFVITLCAPRNIVHVCKLSGRARVSRLHHSHAIGSLTDRVHVQNIDVRGCHQKILNEGGDHVPGFELPFSQPTFRSVRVEILYEDQRGNQV